MAVANERALPFATGSPGIVKAIMLLCYASMKRAALPIAVKCDRQKTNHQQKEAP
jgi:hypothetical protein